MSEFKLKWRDATVDAPRAGDLEIDDPRAMRREENHWRMAHLREATRLREGVLKLQILAGEAASLADAEGQWDQAVIHRHYRDLAEAIRRGTETETDTELETEHENGKVHE